MAIILAGDEPFHCSYYLLGRPCRAYDLLRPQSYRLGSAFQAPSFDERQYRQSVHLLEHFGPVPIRQIEVDYNASKLLVRIVQDRLCFGQGPCIDATQVRSPFEQERQAIPKQTVGLDKQ